MGVVRHFKFGMQIEQKSTDTTHVAVLQYEVAFMVT